MSLQVCCNKQQGTRLRLVVQLIDSYLDFSPLGAFSLTHQLTFAISLS